MLCFNHQSWADPFVIVAALPARPDILFFGPKEADMRIGRKNRLIRWSQRDIPFRPDKRGLIEVARRVRAVFERGDRLAIAPEGRIHSGERVVLPLDEGVAFFALQTGVPIVPIGITGLSWIRFGGTVRVRVGEPIRIEGRPTKDTVREATEATKRALLALVADGRDREPPGRFGRWLTEVFQEWPEGARPPIQDGR
jgi:1-acyl-sn-glycerol-3-phosphate acyltransferase